MVMRNWPGGTVVEMEVSNAHGRLRTVSKGALVDGELAKE